MVLRDEQVHRAVVVIVAGDDDARVFELNLVETDIGGHVFESVRSQIAEQLDLAFAVFRLADGDEVYPTVVVVIESGDAIGVDPVRLWKFDLLKDLALMVAPQRDAGRAHVRESEIHPAVVIEIEHGNTHGWTISRFLPELTGRKVSLARVLENSGNQAGYH